MNQNTDHTLLLVGVNHTTAPIEVRERLAISVARLAHATRTLAHQPGIREAMILSTCNRVEFLIDREASTDNQSPGDPVLTRFVHEYFAVAPSTLEPHLYEFREREAIRHLFRVASSLDSMVVGEPQILGQVKQSWNIAREVGAVKSAGAFSSTLDPLLQRAFSVAKRVRSETRIGSSSVSIASVAVDLARKIFGSLAGKTVLIVGAGKMSDLAARHLIQQGAKTLLVSNRTEERAEKIVAALRTPAITTGVIPFEQLHSEAHRADIVVTSIGVGQIFTPQHAREILHRRRNRPMFFIDIAVPRDVDPAVNKVEGCFVYDIDDLQQVAAHHQASRSEAAEAAESIVTHEVERYQLRRSAAPAVEAIKLLQLSAEVLRQQELARTALRLTAEPFTVAQQAAVDALTKSITAKLLHPQLAVLRESANRESPDRESAGREDKG
ncbi:MAG: glutamyl-tRNA reductase [Acidobacteriota bacterium]|nr:glutamyl-tRNA reductase [Acidobacteriota bacterium]